MLDLRSSLSISLFAHFEAQNICLLEVHKGVLLLSSSSTGRAVSTVDHTPVYELANEKPLYA